MSKVRQSANIATRSALAIATAIFGATLVRIALNGVRGRGWHADWPLAFKLTGTVAVAWFCAQFLYTYLKLRSKEPAEAILDAEPTQSDEHSVPLPGFLAMEYHDLILNRTFFVFIASEGLYGWKTDGPVGADQPTYFEQYAEILKESDRMRNRETARRLSDLKGGFFIPRSDIVSANVIQKQKWGMGRVPHSGRVEIGLASGKSREFILLGKVDAESIQQQILRGY